MLAERGAAHGSCAWAKNAGGTGIRGRNAERQPIFPEERGHISSDSRGDEKTGEKLLDILLTGRITHPFYGPGINCSEP